VKKVVVGLAVFLISSIVYAAEFVPIVHSTAYESSHVITTNPAQALYWISVTWKTSALRYLIIYNATTIPSDGALTASNVLYCGIASLLNDGAPGTKSFDFTQHPLQYGSGRTIPTTAVGMVAIISTDSSGCAVKSNDLVPGAPSFNCGWK